MYNKKHGSPYDRGSADYYYGRSFNPHYWPEGSYKGVMVEQSGMTPEQIAAYTAGYDEETDRKSYD